jgi:hypothetical protein
MKVNRTELNKLISLKEKLEKEYNTQLRKVELLRMQEDKLTQLRYTLSSLNRDIRLIKEKKEMIDKLNLI